MAMDATVAGLIGAVLGAVLGAGAVLGSAWMQQSAQTKRERLKAAADLALAEYNQRIKLVAANGKGVIPPLSTYVAYHADVLDAVARGAFDAAEVANITNRQNALMRAIRDRPPLDH